MNGKALFFKTISVRQKYTQSDFKQVSNNLEVSEGIKMLSDRIGSEQASFVD